MNYNNSEWAHLSLIKRLACDALAYNFVDLVKIQQQLSQSPEQLKAICKPE